MKGQVNEPTAHRHPAPFVSRSASQNLNWTGIGSFKGSICFTLYDEDVLRSFFLIYLFFTL